MAFMCIYYNFNLSSHSTTLDYFITISERFLLLLLYFKFYFFLYTAVTLSGGFDKGSIRQQHRVPLLFPPLGSGGVGLFLISSLETIAASRTVSFGNTAL